MIARRTPAGCGVTKHVLVAHVPEPQDPDGVTELARFGLRFGDHVVAQPGRRCSRASRIPPLAGGRAAVLRLWRQAGVFLIRPDGYIRLARPFVPRAELDELSQLVLSYRKRMPGRGSAWDSLIRRINCLMSRFDSLLGRNKFPVPMRRELRRKPLNLPSNCEPIAALGGPDEQNSLYFPS